MMGLDDILISFAISVAAGNAPTIKSLIEKESLQERLDYCFKKALKRWTLNEEARKAMSHNMPKHINDLKSFIEDGSRGMHPMVKQLMRLWIEEMESDDICGHFLLSYKQDILAVKFENSAAQLKAELIQPIQNICEEQKEQTQKLADIQQLLIKMQQGKNTIKDNEVLVANLISLLNGSIASLIEELKTDTATQLLNELETLFTDAISENTELKAEILYRKAQTITLRNSKKAFELFHESYLLNISDIRLQKAEIKYRLGLNQNDQALSLANGLPKNDELKWVVNIVTSKDIAGTFDSAPQTLKNDKNFRQEILNYINEREIDCRFLFDTEELKTPDVLTYSNVNTWLYIITQYRLYLQDFVFLSLETSQIKLLETPFEVAKKFIVLLNKTEIRDCFPIIRCLYCYWGYITSHNRDFVDEYQSIDKKNFGEQQYFFSLLEASLLMLADRNEEAFATIVAISDHLDETLIRFVIMMSIQTNNVTLTLWILNLCKEKKYVITDDEATIIAHSVNHSNAIVLKDAIEKTEFKNKVTMNVLIQLCSYNAKQQIDVSTFEEDISSLPEVLLSYASLLLSCSGKSQLAFDMMRSIVDENISDIKQRIFLDVLSSMQEKSPELYKILVQNRKAGNLCDDILLQKEYMLDSAVSDFQNALEAIEEIYKRHPEDTNTFAHFIKTLGQVHPERLKDYEDQILNTDFKNIPNVCLVYEALAQNKFLETATELLYKYARQSEDYQFRTFYHNETSTGLISSYARKEFDIAENGLYVLCDINGDRKFYKATLNNPIGKSLLGVRKNDEVIINMAFEEKKLTVLGIYNKYYKLAGDIIREAQDGCNPGLVPFKIDMEHPLDSLEAIIRKMSPNNLTPEEQIKLQQEKYQRGEIGLAQLVSDNDMLSGYYKLLFTPFKINIASCMLTLHNLPKVNETSVFMLDLPTIITFSEFTAKTNFKIEGNMKITTVLHEYLKTTLKTIRRMTSSDMYEALRCNYINNYNDYVDIDAEEHIKRLLQWVQSNCQDVIPTKALAINNPEDQTPLKDELMSSMTMLMESDHYFVTDDKYLAKLLPKANIISTETFVSLCSNVDVKKAYTEFLFDCNFVGVDLTADFIVREYYKTNNSNNGRMGTLMQTLKENPYLLPVVTNAALQLAAVELNINLLKVTLTNMYVMLFKGFSPFSREEVIDTVESSLTFPIYNVQIVRQCVQNARLIITG